MISEYALGKHKWLLTVFFISWGLSAFTLAVLLCGKLNDLWPVIGLILLFVSAAGAVMGGLFDVSHRLHGLAFGLGVPTLPVAALLIGYYLVRNHPGLVGSLLVWSHAPWISVVLMGAAMGVMIAGFKKAGVDMGPNLPPPDHVPAGVIALAGYANRLLVVCYIAWLIVVARMFLKQ